jgi:hypothetical protein
MEDISQQFQGELVIADWIEKAITEENLSIFTNAHKFEPEILVKMGLEVKEVKFWTIGPKEHHGKSLFLYGHLVGGGSIEREITSINPEDGANFVVRVKYGHWYRINLNESIFNYAKKMDMFLSGAYTDVPPLDIRFMLDLE